jgi:hypothetical protein
MSVDTKKCEVGFTDAYRKRFKGRGRNTKEFNGGRKRFEKNYDKIDWSKK